MTGDFTAWAVCASQINKAALDQYDAALIPNPASTLIEALMKDDACVQELIPLRLSPESGDFQLSCGLPVRVRCLCHTAQLL